MKNTTSTQPPSTVDPNRALAAILLIPSLLCVLGLIVAFLVFALCGHLWLLGAAAVLVVVVVIGGSLLDSLAGSGN